MNTDKKLNQQTQSDQWVLDDHYLHDFVGRMLIFILNNFRIIFFMIAAGILFSTLTIINASSTYVGRAVFKNSAFNLHENKDAPIEILERLDAQIKSLASDELKCLIKAPLIVGVDPYNKAKLIGEITVTGQEKGVVVNCINFLLEWIKQDSIDRENFNKKIITDRLRYIIKVARFGSIEYIQEALFLNQNLLFIEAEKFEILRQPYIEESREKFTNTLKKLFLGAFFGLVLGSVIAKLVDVMKRSNNKTISKFIGRL